MRRFGSQPVSDSVVTPRRVHQSRRPKYRVQACVLATVIVSAAALTTVAAQGQASAPVPIPSRNVNMVAGTTLPDGDPFLQRQNEPSGAVSTRNPLHLLVGANDYRTVDLPGLPGDREESTGDAWLGIFKSHDGGQTWRSTLLPGYPQDRSPVGKASPLYGYAAGADGTVRAGTNGLFYYSGLAFNRGTNATGVFFVARFMDNNNTPIDPIRYIDTAIVEKGSAGQFVDKPTLAVDVPRLGAGTCTIAAPGAAPQVVPAGNVYVAYTKFMGSGGNSPSRPPGNPTNNKTQNPVSALMVARSTTCGATWETPIKVSEHVHVSQSATMAIDPVSGAVYIAWREFSTSSSPSAIHVVKSTTGGKTFGKSVQLATITPFDQGGTVSTFRTNSYPSMAIDGTGRVYVAWAERWAAAPGGDARIVMTTSRDGATWTARRPIETARLDPVTSLAVGPLRGHQIMPALTSVGGKVTAIYYDFGDDVSTARGTYVNDAGSGKRHTVDVRAVQALPGDTPVFGPSVRVSQYLMGSRRNAKTSQQLQATGVKPIEQLQYNAPNLPLYSQGEKAFLGDYIDVGGLPFVQDATGKWVYNTAATGAATLHAFWTDNRDVRPPGDGNWANYTPPAVLNPFTGNIGVCTPGQTGMRNANIYSASLSDGLVAGVLSNSKRLSNDVAKTRSFVVVAQNRTTETRRYRLTIVNPPLGGTASFRQSFPSQAPRLLTTVDVTLAAKSSASRTVYVTAPDPKASVKVNIVEVQLPPPGSTTQPPVKSDGLTTVVVINPDVENPDVENPDVENTEEFNPDVENPDLTNPDVENSNITNPDVENPDVENVEIANPDVVNPDVENPDVENPDVENPDVENPDVENPDIENGSIIDVSWTIKNSGNTTGSFAVKPFLTKHAPAGFKKQLILHKVYTTPITKFDECVVKTQTTNVLIANVINPDVENPDVENPDVENPDVENPDVENPDVENASITNATLSLEPGQEARITLRVVNPDTDLSPMVDRIVTRNDGSTETVQVPAAFDPSEAVAPIVFSQAVGTQDVANGVTEPVAVSPLVILTLAMNNAQATVPYFTQLTSAGGEGDRTWSIVTDVEVAGEYNQPLPAGLVLSPSTGVIYGTPATPGLVKFTIRVVDSANPPHVNTQALALLVLAPPPVVVTLEDTTVLVAVPVLGNTGGLPVLAVAVPPANGLLTGAPPSAYSPVPNYNGADSFTYTATLQTSAGPLTSIGTVLLTVLPVNDVPSATPQATSIIEDAPLAITLAGADEETALANLAFTVTTPPSQGVLSGTAPNLTYTPAANFNGADTFAFTVTDRGDPDNCGAPGTACAATLPSAPATVSITVTAFNDAPTFTQGAGQTVLEDAGAQTVLNWATAFSPGPADESGQTVLAYAVVSNTNATLFAVPPAITPAGTLSYTPATNVNGNATIGVTVQDTGGTANGGVDTSVVHTFTITVTPVNDAPSFTRGVDQTVASSAGAQTTLNWATNISTGPADEAGQTSTFQVTAVNPLLFAIPPAISANGTLTFTPSTSGTTSVNVTLTDNGGTANSGVDTSSAQSFQITVTASSHAPVAVDDVASAATSAATTIAVLANDTDIDLDTLTVTSVGAAAHGTVAIGPGGTSVIYTSAGLFEGNDSFSYTISDGQGGTATATVGVFVAGVCSAAPSGLVSWWPGDGNPNDMVGGNPGTLQNGAAYAAGKVGQAFNLDGVGAYVNVGTGFNLDAMTLSAWVYVDPATNLGDRRVISKDNGGDLTLRRVFTLKSSSNWNSGNDGRPSFSVVIGEPATPLAPQIDWVEAPAPLSLGWHHLAGVRDTTAGRFELYVDGALVASKAPTVLGAIDSNVATVLSGISPAYNLEYFAGKIDEAQIYSRALTSLEVSTLVNSGSQGTCACTPEPANLLSWWPGDNNSNDARGTNTLSPNGSLLFGTGKVGDAFRFDGSNNAQATVAHHAPFTIDFWAKADVSAQPTFTGVVSSGTIGAGPTFQVEFDNAGNYRLDAGNLDLALAIGPAGTATFQHIAITYDGSTVRTYLDGQPVAAGTWSGSPLGFDVVKLGINRNGTLGFQGLVDEAHLFSRALAPGEILNLYNAGSAGVCQNRAPQATADLAITTTNTALTLNPAANDTDPDSLRPGLVQTVLAMPPGAPNLVAPGEVAVVTSTGLGYFSASNFIGILDTATNAIAGSIAMPGIFNTIGTKVNQATGLVYFRVGANLLAVDGRPLSATFNQVVLSMTLGTIQSMAIDEMRGLLYATNTTGGTGTLSQGRVTVIDVNPGSPTFHQVRQQVTMPTNESAFGIDVNPVTNKVYVAAGAHVYALDGMTYGLTQVAVSGIDVVVNETANLIYSVTGTTFGVIDGTNNIVTTVTLPGSANTVDSRLAVHKATGRVYVRLSEFPSTSRLVVIDGNRYVLPALPPANRILAVIPIGREFGTTGMAIDEAANLLITTSPIDHKSTVVNVLTSTVLGDIPTPQNLGNVGINPVTHRAYVTGGTGALQVVNLASATLVAQVETGVEVDYLVTDTAEHVAYVPRTGLTTDIQAVDAGGQATLLAPNSEGSYFGRGRNAVTGRTYVANLGTTVTGGGDGLPGFVAVIDESTRSVIANVPAGNRPTWLAVDETLNKIYLANLFSTLAFPGGISVLDGATHALTSADLRLIPPTSATANVTASRLTVNPVTSKLYFQVNGSTASLGVLNGATNVASPLPAVTGTVVLIRVNPVLNRVYVVSQGVGQTSAVLSVLNGATDQLMTTLPVGGRSPIVGSSQSYLAVNRTTGRVFVADFELNTLTEVDGATNTVVRTIPVGRGPTTVAVDETNNRIVVGNSLDRTIMFINGATLRVESLLAVPLMPAGVEVDPAASRVFAVGGCISGSSRCPWFDSGVMVISDPGSLSGSLTVANVTQGANGSVVLNADGSVTYTPNAGFGGVDSYTYTATDGHGGTVTGTVTVTVNAALTITTASLPNGTLGAVYSQVVSATGGTGSRVWSITGALPGGLMLNRTGQISGTPTQSGTFDFTIQAADSATPAQIATQAYTITVGPPVVTTTGLPNGTVGTAYSQTLVVGGATGAVTWTLNPNNNPLLSWLSVSTAGVLSGTPTTPGSSPSFTVTATDSLNQVASRSLSIFANAPLDVTPLREGIVLETQPLTLVGGNGTRSITKTAGALPPGLTLLSSGSFTGTPTRHGTFAFTVEVKDCEPNSTTGLPTCNVQTPQQVISRVLTLRVSAKDQQGSSSNAGTIPFGGAGGRRLAQVFTVGAQGALTGIGLQNITCPSVTPVTVEIQRLTLGGLPDGTTIASGTATTSYNAIALATPVEMAIDERVAFIVSSLVACTFSNTSTTDLYNAGDAYADPGSGWVSLLSTDVRYDLPSFRTLIQPATNVGYLNTSHNSASSALVNGKILYAGGSGNTTAEIYDPATNVSTVTTGAMTVSRANPATVLITGTGNGAVDGTVLLVGGRDTSSVKLSSAETFNPTTGTFTAVTGANSTLSVARDNLRAVMLANGKVLITGGSNSSGSTVSAADLYDPIARTFTTLPNMTIGRQSHVAVLLQSGKVLLAGGYTNGSGGSAELFDPGNNTFTGTTGSMIVSSRGNAAAALLLDGRVLITGGQSGDIRTDAEIYNPATGANGSFSATGPMAIARYNHSATILGDGSVLIAGGYDQSSQSSYILPHATLERFIPGSDTFVAAGSMEARRQSHNATKLSDGRVFLAGGSSQSWMTGNTGEFYDQATVLTLTPATIANAAPNVAIAPVVFSVSGGTAPHQVVSAGGVLPPGVTYNSGTKTLSGTPTSAGLFTFSFRVTDSALPSPHVSVQSYTMRVGTVNTITSPYRLTDGALNAAYATSLSASGAPAVVWSLLPASSALPPGLALSSGGQITGAPTTTGFFTFGVRAVDGQGAEAIKIHAINVTSAMTITTSSISDTVAGATFSQCFNRNNGVSPVSWTLTGTLPIGAAFIPGTGACFDTTAGHAVRQTGSFTVTVTATDSSNPPQVVPQVYTFKVHATDQQGQSSNNGSIGFGGPGGRTVAQVVTVGAQGTLSGVGLQNITCPATTLVTAQIQRLLLNGKPDGNTIASGSVTSNYGLIPTSPGIDMSIGTRYAAVFTSSQACSLLGTSTSDLYDAGDAYVDAGGGYVTLFSTDGRYDIPSFRTLIMPTLPVSYGNNTSRSNHTATTLNVAAGSKVLLVGGSGNTTAELYDPATNQITLTGNAGAIRSNLTATLLTNGQVLVVGGKDNFSNRLSSAELYDPGTGVFTSTGSMFAQRESHVAVLLSTGKVLVAGGQSTLDSTIAAAELYNPADGTFSTAGNMITPRFQFAAVTLQDGKVLIVGGYNTQGSNTTAEIYDPIAQTFTATTGQMVSSYRGRLTTTLLGNGDVLITGGTGSNGDTLNTAEIFDHVAGTFSNTAGLMISKRHGHTATRLADGSVLLAGGYDENSNASYVQPLSTLERYIPGTNSFVSAGEMEARRQSHTASIVGNDKVFLAGGYSQSWMSGNTGELYDPAGAVTISPTTLAPASVGVSYTVSFSGNGGTGPYSTTLLGPPPPGLSFVAGMLFGTPTTNGQFAFAVRVADSASHIGVQSYALTVGAGNAITSPYRLADGALTMPYSAQLTASGQPAVTWSMQPNGNPLPSGLTLSSSGLITGTPTFTGFHIFGVRAVDALGIEANKVHAINISNPLQINTISLSDGLAGNTYGGCISYNSGTGPVSWELTGNIPPGMLLNSNGCFDGTYPARVLRQGGTYSFTATATDSSSPSQVVSRTYTIRVHGQDQQLSTQDPDPGAISLPSDRRVAQVFTSGTPHDLSGLQLWSISACTANTLVTATVWPVTGMPARPDESNSPLGMASVQANASGFFNSMLTFASPIPMPQHARFAVVLSFSGGSCQGINWPTNDWYRNGAGWVNDGVNWVASSTALGRPDVPFATLVMPDNRLSFLSTYRQGHTSVTLSDGRVLLIGNDTTAEIYNPAANALTSTGNMSVPRWGATATPLAGGKALIVGGQYWDNTNQTTVYPATTEIFDPSANGGIGGFSPGPTLATGRQNHRATRFANGRVLITGGNYSDGVSWQTLQSALLFNSNGSLMTTLNMTGARSSHSATLLADGRVLIGGGYTGAPGPPTVAEIYDPAGGGDGTFTGVPNPMTWRAEHTATLLTTGPNMDKVLLAGGSGSYPDLATTSEIFDPALLTFSAAPGLAVARLQHTATALADGRIAFVGGSTRWDWWTPTSSVEVYDPAANTFAYVGDLLVDRAQQTVDALTTGPKAGQLLVAGGGSSSGLSARTLEVFDPTTTALTITTAALPDGVSGVGYAGATVQAAGGTGVPYTFALAWGQLPAGLSLNPNGAISGTPTAGGPASFVVSVTDSASSVAYKSFTIYVDRLTITSTNPLPNAVQGTSYNHQLAATGVGAMTWSLEPGNTMPPGISLSASGLLDGIPPNTGNWYFNVRVTDQAGQTTIKGFSLQVALPMAIATTSLGDGTAGSTYSGGLFTNGGTAPFTWSISGQPIGLQINASTGQFLNSYPLNIFRQGGSFTIAAQVTDSSVPATTATRNIPLNIPAPDQSIGSNVAADVNLTPFRRLAQVFRASSPFPLYGIQPNFLSCDAGVVVTGVVWPVTAQLAPDDSVSPLATATVTANAFGYFNPQNLVFGPQVSMAQGTKFAVVLSWNGNCVQKNWSTADYYSQGDAWLNDGPGWLRTTPEIGHADLPYTTLVMPSTSVRFLAGYRGAHVTAKLNDGRVLLVGTEQYTEVYDPTAHSLTLAADMSHPREYASATVLQNGKVLIAGGAYWDYGTNSYHASATTQIFNPATGLLEAGQNLSTPRSRHTATLLGNGQVLITGGQDLVNNSWAVIQSADIFDGNGILVTTINMTGARVDHTATMLDNGKVLIVGGWGGAPFVAELYDPNTGTFSGVSGAITWPIYHTATRVTTGARAGQVLIAGGSSTTNYPNLSSDSYFFEPITNVFLQAPSLLINRLDHTATDLPNGRIVFAGGVTEAGNWSRGTPSVEIYDPVTDERALVGNLITDRLEHQANLVSTPSGVRLAVSGGNGSSAMVSRTIELVDLGPLDGESGSFSPSAPLLAARQLFGTALLPDGKVLIAGGNANTTASEVYDPATGTTTSVANMLAARCYGCAVAKLLDGRVLVAGGSADGYVALASAEIFDPATNTWSATGNMPVARIAGLPVVLNSGLVLITGGTTDGTQNISTSVLFNPATGTFAFTGSMATGRYVAAVSKLADGRVLVAGGLTSGNTLTNTAEVYDPLTGTFSPTGSMSMARAVDYATLLLDGRVLIAGSINTTDLAEVYNPGSGTFTTVGSMTTPRNAYTVVRLNNGLVLIMGGRNQSGTTLATAEVFDPVTNIFTRSADMATPRRWGKAILLSDGRVMISGGQDNNNVILDSVEIFNPNQ